jgi:hypothetical protein
MAILADQIAQKLGSESRYVAGRFKMRYDYAGSGYGVVSDMEREGRFVRLPNQKEFYWIRFTRRGPWPGRSI